MVFVMEIKKCFSQKLTLTHISTKTDEKSAANETIFKARTCSLNWNKDVVAFTLEINNKNLLDIKKFSKFVTYYDSSGPQTLKQSERELKLNIDDATKESGVTTIYVYAGFKDNLLNLFSPHKKSFNLMLNYVMFDKNYCTTFSAVVPNVTPT